MWPSDSYSCSYYVLLSKGRPCEQAFIRMACATSSGQYSLGSCPRYSLDTTDVRNKYKLLSPQADSARLGSALSSRQDANTSLQADTSWASRGHIYTSSRIPHSSLPGYTRVSLRVPTIHMPGLPLAHTPIPVKFFWSPSYMFWSMSSFPMGKEGEEPNISPSVSGFLCRFNQLLNSFCLPL